MAEEYKMTSTSSTIERASDPKGRQEQIKAGAPGA